jgi:hypothetical protein
VGRREKALGEGRRQGSFADSRVRVAAQNFTGGYWQYVFEQNGNAIGDFNMIDATSGLIIERDNGEGTDDKACPQSQPARTASPISASSSDDNEFMLLEVGKFLKTK